LTFIGAVITRLAICCLCLRAVRFKARLPTLLGYVNANYQTKLLGTTWLTVALSSQQLLNVNLLFKL
jgi:hypothetical protein